MHCKSFWINSFSAAWNDGWVCMACWDTWGGGGQVRRWLLGSWQRGYGSLALKSPWGWRHSAPAYFCCLWLIPFGKCSHAHSHTHTHIIGCAQRHSTGLSPDLLNLASDSGTYYWKRWPEFYVFDLGGEKYCKGYQHGRGRPAPIVSPVCYYTYSLKQTLALTSN